MAHPYKLITAILVFTALPSWCVEKASHHGHKMWYMGRVISLQKGEFAFRTRWYSSRTVYVNEGTSITCAGRVFPLAGMHSGDVVEIDALIDDAGIHATKIKVHISRKACDARTAPA